MQFDFLAQSPLKADAIAVAHDQHPDHKLWINRRPADLAVEGCQLLTKSSQQPRHHRIDPAQQMTSRNALFEVEQVEKLALIARLPTHHGKPPPLIASSQTESLFADEREPFFNAIDPTRTFSLATAQCQDRVVARTSLNCVTHLNRRLLRESWLIAVQPISFMSRSNSVRIRPSARSTPAWPPAAKGQR